MTQTATMPTLVLHSPGDLRLTQTPAPTPDDLKPGEALVRVRCVGICGTDLHAFRGRQPFFTYPRILGHELGVEVVAVGQGVQNVAPGDKCAVEPYLWCGTCVACRRGKTNCCETLQCLGVHCDGGMREFLVLPASNLHPSQTLSLEQLALVETLGIGAHAVYRAQIAPGETVLVRGAGPIGLSIIPFAQATGARVIVSDVNHDRLAFARDQFHVEATLDASGLAPAAFAETLKIVGDGGLPTVVFDATGNKASMEAAFDCVAPGGKVVFVGLVQNEICFSDPLFHKREITLLASRNSTPRDFSHIIGLMERGELDTRPWITHRIAAPELPARFAGLLEPGAGVLKAVVTF